MLRAQAHRRKAFILDGYAPAASSMSCCIRALFYLHNETGNILTHLVSLLLFTWLTMQHFADEANWETPLDVAAFAVYLGATIVCFSTSTAYHLMSSCGPGWQLVALRLDETGAIVVAASPHVVLLMYGYPCHPSTWLAYTTAVGATAVAGLLWVWTRPYGRLRTEVKLALGAAMFAAGWLNAVHLGTLYDVPGMRADYALCNVLALVAVGVYVLKVPERWWPGRFDIWVRMRALGCSRAPA